MSDIYDFITGQMFLDTDDERIRQKIERLLIQEKGYSKKDIEVDIEFKIVIGKEIHKSKVDLVVSVGEKRFMIIKCARGSLVSREREVISSARLLDVYQIPFAVVTNGEDAEVLDTISGEVISGEVIGNGLETIPSKANAIEAIKHIEFKKLLEEKIEKEKRIFLAFDTIKCPSKCD